MADLSPTTEVVLHAAFDVAESPTAPIAAIVAAALRAVVEQLGYSNVPEEFAHLVPLVIDSDELLAIAAELEGTSD